MIVSHARKFIFFHNPKCAGTSFRDALLPYHDDPFSFWGIYEAPYFRTMLDHTHIRLWELQELFPHLVDCTSTYRSVIFVRNPYERFLSAVDEHFRQFQPQISLTTVGMQQQTKIIEAFVTRLLRAPLITGDCSLVHFSPQIWQIKLSGRIVPRHVLPLAAGCFDKAFACLDLPPANVPWHNKAATKLDHLLDSKIVDRFISEFYEPDLQFLRADPELASLARRPVH